MIEIPVISLKLKSKNITLGLFQRLENFKRTKILAYILILICTVFYIFRGLQYITRPQLYAEDGTIWIANAYNDGLRSIFMPYDGLAHLFERIFSFVSINILPLKYEPFYFNTMALLIFILLCYYLFSYRLGLLNNYFQKIYVAISLSLIANANEFFFNFSNSVFLLGLIGLFIIIARPSTRLIVRLFEKVLFAILCFTLIFSWIYLLILLLEVVFYKTKRTYYLIWAIIGSFVQFIIYTFLANNRPSVPIRYLMSKTTLIELYNQIIIPSVRFARIDINPLAHTRVDSVLISFFILISLLATSIVLVKANKSTRYFLFFCLAMTLASLKSPLVAIKSPAEIVNFMATAQFGNRYFIFGIIGMFVIWAKFSQMTIRAKFLPYLALIFFFFGLATSITSGSFYVNKGFTNLSKQYSSGIALVENPKTNSSVIIPINPSGWFMQLDKNNKNPLQ